MLKTKAPFTLLRFQLKTEQNLSVFALRSHCSDMKTEKFKYANNSKYFKAFFNAKVKYGKK